MPESVTNSGIVHSFTPFGFVVDEDRFEKHFNNTTRKDFIKTNIRHLFTMAYSPFNRPLSAPSMQLMADAGNLCNAL
jgi:hypothetical protein